MNGANEREINLIIQNQQDMKDDIRELRGKFQDFCSNLDVRLDNVGTLLQTHNGRMDDFELKQVQLSSKFQAYVTQKIDETNKEKDVIDLKEKRRAWIYPLIAFIVATIVSILLKLM